MQKLTFRSEIFIRAVEDIITREELKKKLASGRPLRIKFGVDITAPRLHIGHAVNLWKMRELQEYGHKVIFLIGDFTTLIGDPTARLESRPQIAASHFRLWEKNFIKEISRILLTNKKVFEVRRNSEWYGKMKARELVELLNLFTHARLIERDMFQQRIRKKRMIRLPELIYPILQGYDSYMLKSDLAIIGSDQLFNENIGRWLQKEFHQSPQIIITTVITPGLEGGPKMSKSLGNYIGLGDSPQEKFGKAMRLRDSLITQYLEVYTDVPRSVIRQKEAETRAGRNLMEAKLFFAEALVRRYHGEMVARRERERFLKVFSRHELPSHIVGFKIRYGKWNPVELMVKTGLASSKSEARRLIQQRGVKLNGQVVTLEFPVEIYHGSIVQVGKRRFLKIK